MGWIDLANTRYLKLLVLAKMCTQLCRVLVGDIINPKICVVLLSGYV